MLSWAEVCENPHLKELPYKIETNRFGKIVMSARRLRQGQLQSAIACLLGDLMSFGRTLMETAIETSDGTKVADVAWISQGRFAPHKEGSSLPIAPEICVEILSNSNTKEEMQGKMQLYFSAGAQEVWLCDESGKMEFFRFDAIGAIPQSRLCRDFPGKLDLE